MYFEAPMNTNRPRLSLLTLIILCVQYAYSQTGLVKQWDYRFGGTDYDTFHALQYCGDGGFVIGGSSLSGINGNKTAPNKGSSDYWAVKVDSLGIAQWDKSFGGSAGDGLLCIDTSSDGGVFLSGISSSLMGSDKTENSRGLNDFWVIKIDTDGNRIWDKTLGSNLQDIPYAFQSTPDGGCMVGGFSDSDMSDDKTEACWDPTHNYDDYWVVKLDATGYKEWDRTLGGLEQDGLTAISVVNNEGYILGGSSSSDSSGNKTQHTKGNFDYWIVKLDTAGNILWDKAYGGNSSDYLTAIVNTNDRGFLLGGYSLSDIGGDKTQNSIGGVGDYWIVKIDSLGNKQWDKTYGGLETEELTSIEVLSDGGYLLSGRSASDGGPDKSEDNLGGFQTWVIKIDSVGNKEWDKTIFTTAWNGGYAVQAGDKCFAVAANTSSGVGGHKTQASWGINDYWLVKFCEQTVGINEITAHVQMQVYPNPFANEVSISIQQQQLHEATFTITNAAGQVVYHRIETNLSNSYTKMLDLSNLSKGLYFVTVQVGEERMVRQVVKE